MPRWFPSLRSPTTLLPPPPAQTTASDSQRSPNEATETEALQQSILWTTFPPTATSRADWTLELPGSVGLSPPTRLRTYSSPSLTPSPRSREFSNIRRQNSSSGESGTVLLPSNRHFRQRSNDNSNSSPSSNAGSQFTFGAAGDSSSNGRGRGASLRSSGVHPRAPSSYASVEEDSQWGSPVPGSLSTRPSGDQLRELRGSGSGEEFDEEDEEIAQMQAGASPRRRKRVRGQSNGVSTGGGDGDYSRGSTDEGSLVYKVAESLYLASLASSSPPSKASAQSHPSTSPHRYPSTGYSFSRDARRRPKSLSIATISSLCHIGEPSPDPFTDLHPKHNTSNNLHNDDEDNSDADSFHSVASAPALPLYYTATTTSAKDALAHASYLVEPSSRAAIAWSSCTSPLGEEDAVTLTGRRVKFLSGVSSIVMVSPPLSPTYVVPFAQRPPTSSNDPFTHPNDSSSTIQGFKFGEREDIIEIPLPAAPINSRLLPTPGYAYSSQSVLPSRGRKGKVWWGKRIPVGGWLFMLGFLFPPFWWYCAFGLPLPSTPSPSFALSSSAMAHPGSNPADTEGEEKIRRLSASERNREHLFGPMSSWPDKRPGARTPDFVSGGTRARAFDFLDERRDSRRDSSGTRAWREGQQSFLRWKQKCKVMSLLSLGEICAVIALGIWSSRAGSRG